LKSGLEKKDRRAADRFPIEREVRYKVLNRKNADEVGLGKTVNMSSGGVLFTTDQYFAAGTAVGTFHQLARAVEQHSCFEAGRTWTRRALRKRHGCDRDPSIRIPNGQAIVDHE
jgi:hypothetical protein